MTDRKDVKIRRKPRPKQDQENKEQASNKNRHKRRRWKKHHKRPKKNLGESLQELRAFINSKYHAD